MLKLENIKNWEDMIGNVCWGNCLDFMKLIPDKSIDLILTDPPYGIGESNEKNSTRGKCFGSNRKGALYKAKDYDHYEWDKNKIDKIYFQEMFRISKNQIIFGGNYYGSILGDTSCYIVWDKDNGQSDFADCELAWTSFKTAVRKFKFRWNGMLQENMKQKEIRKHPTQKPLELMRWILVNYSKDTDLVCDPFIGSGTTARACKDLGRRWIGIEKEEKYCTIAEERLKQQNLFTN